MSKVYTVEEVQRHNHEKDLWIVYKDGVYDITKFVQEHPGGEEVLINLAGKDATTCFDEIGHSGEAIQLRETYKIGTVDGVVVSGSVSGGGGTQPEKPIGRVPRRKKSSQTSSILAIIISILLFMFYLHIYLP